MSATRVDKPTLPDCQDFATQPEPAVNGNLRSADWTGPQTRNWRKSFKQALLHTAQAAGGFRWAENARWRNNRLLILCYHGIAMEDEHQWNGELFISPAQLESRLEVLRERCTVLRLDEGLERLQKKELPPNSVALTFDDGFANTYKAAWPLMQRYNIPFTVYLTTYYCDAQLPVFQLICSFLLWKARGAVLRPFEAFGTRIRMDLRQAKDRDAVVRAMENTAAAQGLSGAEKDDFAAALADHLRLDYQEVKRRRLLHLMKPREIAELAGSGVEFGLHTHRHRLPATASEFNRELDENAERIRSWTGQNPKHFCYPGGFHRPELVRWLRQRNMISATTCNPGLAARGHNPLLLPRVIDHSSISMIEYQSWLAGIGHFVPRLKAEGAGAAGYAG